MTKKLDTLIAAANAELAKAEKGSDAEKTLIGRVEALTSMKTEGVGFTQDDLNARDRAAKEEEAKRWQKVTGMPLDELESTIADVEGSLTGGQGDGEGESDDPVIQRLQAELQAEQNRVKELEGKTTEFGNFQRNYYREKVEGNIAAALKAAGLNEQYLSPAQQLAEYEELVEKSLKGEEVGQDEYTAIAHNVKETAPVFFEVQDDPENPYAGIPATPELGEIDKITDEQRAQVDTGVF